MTYAPGTTCLALLLLLVSGSLGQETAIRTTVPLVVVPTSVVDRRGEHVNGLSGDDFILLDEGKPRVIFADESDPATRPVSLVIAIQMNDISRSALDKIRKTGTLITDAVLGANGEVAVIGFSERVTLLQDFTHDSSRISAVFQRMKSAHARKARMVDAVDKGLDLIAARASPRRAALVIISESRDRGSAGSLDDLLKRLERSDTIIYGLSYSAYATHFTTTAIEPPAESCSLPLALMALCYAPELARLARTNTVAALVQATGGQGLAFQTLAKLEADLLHLSEDLHSRYTLSFAPDSGAAEGYHRLELQVRNNPEAIVRARPGYWLSRSDTPGSKDPATSAVKP